MGTTADWRGMVFVRGGTCQLLTDTFIESNTIIVLQFCTKVYCACQEQCHVSLGSHLTKPCLLCVVTRKTAAIHVWAPRYSRVHVP